MISPLGQLLCDAGAIEASILPTAAENARSEGVRIGEYLIRTHNVAEEVVYETLARQFALPFFRELNSSTVEGALQKLPLDVFREELCLPVKADETVVEVVMADPLDLNTPAAIACATGLSVLVAIAPPSLIAEVQKRIFEGSSTIQRLTPSLIKAFEREIPVIGADLSLEEIRKKTESQPVVRLVALLFEEAIKLRASDIHIEPQESMAVVRLRIDGLLVPHAELARALYVPVISRIKILADLDIAEKRIPQDGRIRYECYGRDYDFRISTLPTHFGEKIVVRILKHDESLLDVNNLGLSPPEMNSLLSLIEKPQGMLLVTGPTGSGKSATLFACLNRIRHKSINITTIENPIEHKLDGVNQVQINEKAGISFASVLRSILRQDPDVILVGEIRDEETAEIAIQASQTGHLVFSTLHTNDAVSAITRLRDLRVPGFLIASSLLGVIAQRLVRMLCPHCKRPGKLSADFQSRWRSLLADFSLPEIAYRPIGCDKCSGLGYWGRTGIFEMVLIDEKLRTMITANASEGEIRRACRKSGMRTLIDNGIAKIEQSITTPEEILRVVMVPDTMHGVYHLENID